MSELKTKTVDELKKLLRAKGLSPTGKKSVLLNRLINASSDVKRFIDDEAEEDDDDEEYENKDNEDEDDEEEETEEASEAKQQSKEDKEDEDVEPPPTKQKASTNSQKQLTCDYHLPNSNQNVHCN